jgi:hypothetical protein
LKSPRNDTGIAMTNLHCSPSMNQSKTDLGIVNESLFLRFGINTIQNSRKTPHRHTGVSTQAMLEAPVDAMCGFSRTSRPDGFPPRAIV